MAEAELEKVVARVAWIIGARGDNFNDTISDDRFILEEIQRAVIETEAEVVRALAEGYHPMRADFLQWTNDLDNGEVLPTHLGQVEAIRIRPYTGADYEIAEATSRSNIKDWRKPGTVFDDIAHDQSGSGLAGYFNLTNETLTYTGYAAQALVVDYSPDFDTPELQVDSQFEGTLVAGTIPRLNKLGVPQALTMTYGGMYSQFLGLIRSGVAEMPTLTQAQASE